ncbi:MAG: lysozyme inhibitor LprI family protein [Rhodanobacter sp.]
MHKLATPDPLYDPQLLRDVAIINERTVRELGPMPPGGLPTTPKRKPKLWRHDVPFENVNRESEEGETMKLSHVAMAAALGVVATGTLVATDQQVTPGYRPSFELCSRASHGVTVELMNCGSEEFEYQGKRLNNAYKRLHQVLPSTAWESLRNEQRKWLVGLGKACEVDDDIKGGTAEMLMVMACKLDRTVQRANELESLLIRQG